MRTSSLALIFGLGFTLPGQCAVFVNSFNDTLPNNGSIDDGSPAPWSDTRTISGISGPITGITVRLNLSGGSNGDLYAYINYNNTLVPLINRLGVGTTGGLTSFGYDDAGLDVTFSDAATHNIHAYQSVGGYSIASGALWQPDGRAINPYSSASAFNASGTVSLSVFNGMSANGNWSLVLADVVNGGGSPTVVSWGVDITAVPEPSQWASLTALTLAAAALRRRIISTQSRQEAGSAKK